MQIAPIRCEEQPKKSLGQTLLSFFWHAPFQRVNHAKKRIRLRGTFPGKRMRCRRRPIGFRYTSVLGFVGSQLIALISDT